MVTSRRWMGAQERSRWRHEPCGRLASRPTFGPARCPNQSLQGRRSPLPRTMGLRQRHKLDNGWRERQMVFPPGKVPVAARADERPEERGGNPWRAGQRRVTGSRHAVLEAFHRSLAVAWQRGEGLGLDLQSSAIPRRGVTIFSALGGHDTGNDSIGSGWAWSGV